ATEVLMVSVYATLGCSAAPGRSVSTLLPLPSDTDAAICEPSGPVSTTLPALAPLTDAGSIAREKRTTTGDDNGTFVAPSTGVIDVTTGAAATMAMSIN